MSKLKEILVWVAIALLFCVFVAVGALPFAAYGHAMYGDWRCGFSQCRIIVEAP